MGTARALNKRLVLPHGPQLIVIDGMDQNEMEVPDYLYSSTFFNKHLRRQLSFTSAV